jgi:type IV pilus assembly protein PilA
MLISVYEMKSKKLERLGFSLIELMVVVAIVSILAAVAVPVYSKYSIKSKLTGPIQITESVIKTLQSAYALKGVYPNNFTFNGVSVSSSGSPWTTVNHENIYALQYAISADGKGAMLAVNPRGLQGIPGYVDGNMTNGVFVMAARDAGNSTRVACGIFHPTLHSWAMIPSEYRPAGCQCLQLILFNDTGAGC